MISMRAQIAVLCLLLMGFSLGEELSGYIDISGSRGSITDGSHLFYWFAPATNKFESAPVVLWLQGPYSFDFA